MCCSYQRLDQQHALTILATRQRVKSSSGALVLTSYENAEACARTTRWHVVCAIPGEMGTRTRLLDRTERPVFWLLRTNGAAVLCEQCGRRITVGAPTAWHVPSRQYFHLHCAALPLAPEEVVRLVYPTARS